MCANFPVGLSFEFVQFQKFFLFLKKLLHVL